MWVSGGGGHARTVHAGGRHVGEPEDHPRRGGAAVEYLANRVVDVVELTLDTLDVGAPAAVQLEDLLEVTVGANDRALHGQPAEDGLEDRQAHLVLRGQPNAHQCPTPRERPQRLLERRRRDGCRDRLVGAAKCLDRRYRVLFADMNYMLGSELSRGVQALLVDIDGDDRGARGTRVLDREVSEPTGSEHGDQAGGAGTGDLHGLVGRDARAGQRGGVERVDVVGYAHDMTRVSECVLGEAAVHPVARVDL